MVYTIKEVSEKFHLNIPTLHYYEKEGLLPPIKRLPNGNREYTDKDLEWLALICCFRNTGMSISNIKHYFELCKLGKESVNERHKMLLAQKEHIQNEIEVLKASLITINKKINYYEKQQKEDSDAINPIKGICTHCEI